MISAPPSLKFHSFTTSLPKPFGPKLKNSILRLRSPCWLFSCSAYHRYLMPTLELHPKHPNFSGLWAFVSLPRSTSKFSWSTLSYLGQGKNSLSVTVPKVYDEVPSVFWIVDTRQVIPAARLCTTTELNNFKLKWHLPLTMLLTMPLRTWSWLLLLDRVALFQIIHEKSLKFSTTPIGAEAKYGKEIWVWATLFSQQEEEKAHTAASWYYYPQFE
jgi:hypothetical protein